MNKRDALKSLLELEAIIKEQKQALAATIEAAEGTDFNMFSLAHQQAKCNELQGSIDRLRIQLDSNKSISMNKHDMDAYKKIHKHFGEIQDAITNEIVPIIITINKDTKGKKDLLKGAAVVRDSLQNLLRSLNANQTSTSEKKSARSFFLQPAEGSIAPAKISGVENVNYQLQQQRIMSALLNTIHKLNPNISVPPNQITLMSDLILKNINTNIDANTATNSKQQGLIAAGAVKLLIEQRQHNVSGDRNALTENFSKTLDVLSQKIAETESNTPETKTQGKKKPIAFDPNLIDVSLAVNTATVLLSVASPAFLLGVAGAKATKKYKEPINEHKKEIKGKLPKFMQHKNVSTATKVVGAAIGTAAAPLTSLGAVVETHRKGAINAINKKLNKPLNERFNKAANVFIDTLRKQPDTNKATHAEPMTPTRKAHQENKKTGTKKTSSTKPTNRSTKWPKI